MDETKRRSQRAGRVIWFCEIRRKALHSGNKRVKKRADNLTLPKLIEAARERERGEESLHIESLRKHLSPREVVTVREREERDKKLFAPSKRPRTRHRRSGLRLE
jgi:hypothetical protein